MVEEAKNISVNDAVGALLGELPQVVREFVQGPQRDAIALQLTQKHGLHVDQAGTFQLAYIQMLLGAISPEEFSKTLRDTGLPDATVRALTNDVNELVFKPLREKERLGFKEAATSKGIRTSPSVSASVVAPAAAQPKTPPPAPHYAPEPLAIRTPQAAPAQSLPPLVPPKQPTHPAASVPPSAPAVQQAPAPFQKQVSPPANLPGIAPEPSAKPMQPLYPSYSPRTAPPEIMGRPAVHEPASGEIRTMQSDMLAVSEQREPAAVSYKAQISATLPQPPVVPHPDNPPTAPHVPATPAPGPVESAAPASTMPQRGEPHIAPVPGAPRPRVSPTLNELVVQEYTQDPYREPIK